MKWELSVGNIRYTDFDLTKYLDKLDHLEATQGDLIVPIEIVTTFDNVSNLIQTKVDMHNRAIDKEEQKAAAYLQDQDNKGRTNVAMAPSGRGALVEKESVQDYWTPTMTAEILIYAYGIIAATMTRRKYFGCPLLDGCFGCNKYPHRLPPAKKIVDEAFLEFSAKYTDGRLHAPKGSPIIGGFRDDDSEIEQGACCCPSRPKAAGSRSSNDNMV